LEALHLSNKGLVALQPGCPPEFVELLVETDEFTLKKD
jgi:hypothetical protein